MTPAFTRGDGRNPSGSGRRQGEPRWTAGSARPRRGRRLRGLVQLLLGEPVKLGPIHSSTPGRRVPKHVGGWPRGPRRRIPAGITAPRLFRPEALVLFVRESLEALEELPRQARSGRPDAPSTELAGAPHAAGVLSEGLGRQANGSRRARTGFCFGRGILPRQAPRQARNSADHLSAASRMTRRPSRRMPSTRVGNRHSLEWRTA